MVQTDPIADMLTIIRNGTRAGHDSVVIPSSRIKLEVIKVLKGEGFIKKYETVTEGIKKSLKVTLKYDAEKNSAINEIKRISKPGRRIYSQKQGLPKFKNGYGSVLLSTNKGILTAKEARMQNLGGEVLCTVW